MHLSSCLYRRVTFVLFSFSLSLALFNVNVIISCLFKLCKIVIVTSFVDITTEARLCLSLVYRQLKASSIKLFTAVINSIPW